MFLQDDSAGNINLCATENSKTVIITPNVGTVNYTTGKVQINSIVFTAYTGSKISIYALPAYSDVKGVGNTILRIKSENVTVSPEAE